MFFTEDDLRNIIAWATWRTCVSLGIIANDLRELVKYAKLAVVLLFIIAVAVAVGHLR